ncbi:MAG: hypothetical protein Kilf2KO_26250 [Rhodospirillales bacterium]
MPVLSPAVSYCYRTNLMSNPLEQIWLAKIFKAEFAFSDVRSDYSRVYSWMANQLGHMTLGIFAALLFYWIVETAKAAIAASQDQHCAIVIGAIAIGAVLLGLLAFLPRGSEEPATPDCTRPDQKTLTKRLRSALMGVLALSLGLPLLFDFICYLLDCGPLAAPFNAFLLGVTICVISLVLLIALAVSIWRPPPSPKTATAYWHSGRKTRIGINAIALLLFVILPVLSLGHPAPNDTDKLLLLWGSTDLAKVAPTLLAGLFFSVAMTAMAKDARFAVLGLLASVLAVLVAGPVPQVLFPWLLTETSGFTVWTAAIFGLTVLAVGLGLFVWPPVEAWRGRGRRRSLWPTLKAEQDIDYDRLFYAVAILIIAVLTGRLLYNGLESLWQLPAACVIAALAISIAKEFGNDIPNVHIELQDAQATRCRAGGPHDDTETINRSYLDAALWDTRTDCLFYLAGAWIAGGILSSGSLIDDGLGAWSVGAEIIGLLVVTAAFLLGGKNWALRQQALDRIGVIRANMLAVMDCPIRWRPGSGTPINPGEELADLFAFSRNDSSHSTKYRHALFIGNGRYNDRLADALVTEAALADLPPRLTPKLLPPQCWRLARKISFGRLLDYDPVNLRIVDLPYTSLWELDFQRPRQAVFALESVEELSAGKTREASDNLLRAADLVAVTRCKTQGLPDAVDKLHAVDRQMTAWFFNLADDLPSPDALRSALASALQKKTEANDIVVFLVGQEAIKRYLPAAET